MLTLDTSTNPALYPATRVDLPVHFTIFSKQQRKQGLFSAHRVMALASCSVGCYMNTATFSTRPTLGIRLDQCRQKVQLHGLSRMWSLPLTLQSPALYPTSFPNDIVLSRLFVTLSLLMALKIEASQVNTSSYLFILLRFFAACNFSTFLEAFVPCHHGREIWGPSQASAVQHDQHDRHIVQPG